MLSFIEKRAIILSFPELIEIQDSEGRVNYEYIESKKRRKVIAREFHPSGNGYVYSDTTHLYDVDERGWVQIKDFTEKELRLIIMRAIVSLSEEAENFSNSLIFRPIKYAEEWRSFLTDPDKQWKSGYSAKELAYSWQNSINYLPSEIQECMNSSCLEPFQDLQVLQAIPEYKVPLPGGSRPSQNDLFVLAKGRQGLVSIMVEGKVSEPFGPSLAEWDINGSKGKNERFQYIKETLNITKEIDSSLRYQLFHRAASAVIEAKKYGAKNALMLVHSFSDNNDWFDDYEAFIYLFNLSGKINQIIGYHQINDVNLYFGWIKGESRK
ncbi:DUF6946 family protein [Brevibacillus ginsengisoli]|uniref:DUF6946 family protein n=1 Tax=Brevibacillus ginsengisoli TaxID=363854 RepID=UPI003CF44F22